MRLAHLGGDLQAHSRGAGNGDRPMHSLVRRHAAEQRDVPAIARSDRKVVDVDTVMNDGVDRQVCRVGVRLRDGDQGDPRDHRAVEGVVRASEGVVVGGDDRKVRESRRVDRVRARCSPGPCAPCLPPAPPTSSGPGIPTWGDTPSTPHGRPAASHGPTGRALPRSLRTRARELAARAGR